tara:strand:- start:24 stop:221 length:198 start_codon:yes stop_codon:yes gene_type:complete
MAKKVSKTPTSKKIDELNKLRKSFLNLRFQKNSGQLEKTSEIKKIKKRIAVLLTAINYEKGANNA